jgi:hypothetical protein
VDLYRVFPWNPQSRDTESGGAFFIARDKQGQGRYDIPHLDGVYYCGQERVSAVSEFIQAFRGQTVTDAHFERPDGLVMAIVHFELDPSVPLMNLDDPKILMQLKIRPSQVLTRNRDTTRSLAERLYAQGNAGFLWPSALEASWTNASLFESRVRKKLSIFQKPKRLSIGLPEVIEAAAFLRITL